MFEPLVGELFRSGFLMQVGAANNDFMTPSVIAAAEGDYERNLANTIDLDLPAGQRREVRRAKPHAVPGLGDEARRPGRQGRQAAAADLVASRIPSRSALKRRARCPKSGSRKILGELNLSR